MLAAFAETYDVQVLQLAGSEARPVWRPTQQSSALPAGLPPPTSDQTNLAAGIASSTAEQGGEQRGAVGRLH
jgi:hypothetical protein